MRRLAVPLLLLVVSGCSFFSDEESEKPAPVRYFPVCLQLHSHPRLNWFRGTAHTVFARVFPLTSVDGFESTAIEKLLAPQPPPIAGLAGTPQQGDSFPGAVRTYTIDAVGGQQFTNVGIAVGYFAPLGKTKLVVPTEGVPTGSCFVVDLGEAAIGAVTAPPPAPPAAVADDE